MQIHLAPQAILAEAKPVRPRAGCSRQWTSLGGQSGALALTLAFRSRRVALRSRGFGGDVKGHVKSSAKPTTTSPEVFATSEVEVAKFKEEVVKSMDDWCDELLKGLRDRGWWASSGSSLPLPLCGAMREEVEELWHQGHFMKSQSVLDGNVYYDKKNVYATEVTRERYLVCPRLWHYTVALTQELVRRVNVAFPGAGLSDKFIGNKLNMSIGNGAAFDAHLDVGVAEKPYNRKLSLLVYLNPSWRPSLGGEINLLGEGQTEAEAACSDPARLGLPAKVTPISGRLVAFWSDRILHKVEASEAAGIDDFRVSYVIWLLGLDEGPEKPTEPKESAPSWAL